MNNCKGCDIANTIISVAFAKIHRLEQENEALRSCLVNEKWMDFVDKNFTNQPEETDHE